MVNGLAYPAAGGTLEPCTVRGSGLCR